MPKKKQEVKSINDQTKRAKSDTTQPERRRIVVTEPGPFDHVYDLIERTLSEGEEIVQSQENFAQLKSFVKTGGGDAALFTIELLMDRLPIHNARSRLKLVEFIHILFMRSHVIRKVVVDSLDQFIALSTGLSAFQTSSFSVLPGPPSFTPRLKQRGLQVINIWGTNEKFATIYPQLHIARRFLVEQQGIKFESHEDFVGNSQISNNLTALPEPPQPSSEQRLRATGKFIKVLDEMGATIVDNRIQFDHASCLLVELEDLVGTLFEAIRAQVPTTHDELVWRGSSEAPFVLTQSNKYSNDDEEWEDGNRSDDGTASSLMLSNSKMETPAPHRTTHWPGVQHEIQLEVTFGDDVNDDGNDISSGLDATIQECLRCLFIKKATRRLARWRKSVVLELHHQSRAQQSPQSGLDEVGSLVERLKTLSDNLCYCEETCQTLGVIISGSC